MIFPRCIIHNKFPKDSTNLLMEIVLKSIQFLRYARIYKKRRTSNFEPLENRPQYLVSYPVRPGLLSRSSVRQILLYIFSPSTIYTFYFYFKKSVYSFIKCIISYLKWWINPMFREQLVTHQSLSSFHRQISKFCISVVDIIFTTKQQCYFVIIFESVASISYILSHLAPIVGVSYSKKIRLQNQRGIHLISVVVSLFTRQRPLIKVTLMKRLFRLVIKIF